MNNQFDIAIIGGGVIGSAVARELARYRVSVCVLEKEKDVVNGVSGRNTGLLHTGILYDKGSLRHVCSMEGNAEFDKVARELDVPFKRCGKLIVGSGAEERPRLEALLQKGIENGVPGVRMIERAELAALEPNALGDCAIWAPSAGILCPFTYTIALAENAAANGVQYFFGREVTGIAPSGADAFAIDAGNERFTARWIVNCAGLFAYKISGMLGFFAYRPNRVKGQYIILDKHIGRALAHPIYPAPNEAGAFDVHITPTVDGNILVGPTIENAGERVDYDVTREMLDILNRNGRKLFAVAWRDACIRNYAGIFPTIENPAGAGELDFQIQSDATHPRAVNLVGITSPGLTSALPIARRVVEKIRAREPLSVNEAFCPTRKGIVRFAEQTRETQERLIREDPDYGEIYCRCECVTKAEIRRAMHNILGVDTVSGIKYRTRATMGRCQGGYCESRITSLMQQELHKKREEILLNKPGAYMFVGEVKHEEL